MRDATKELILKHSKKIKTREDLAVIKRSLALKYGITMLSNADIQKVYRELLKKGEISRSDAFEKILKRRTIRTLSGIAPVAVLTKPFLCPGNCAYCPSEKDVPQSYLSNEPAVMRAIRCGYAPYLQVQTRLEALENNGHEPTKIELIVIGGTWSYFPEQYKYWYIAECFRGANEYNTKKSAKIRSNTKIEKLKERLKIEQKKNEKSEYKIIGLTLETRQDYINDTELLEMRDLGATRVEIGVQAIDDKILAKNLRGHDTQSTIDATKLLKEYGFKVTYHFMSGLPGSNPKKDFEMFEKICKYKDFCPDQIKFYPTVVTKGSLLYEWWKKGDYKPYSDKVLQDLIIKCKAIIPKYIRVIRLIRDIPGESIIAGNKITNLRQIMQDKGLKCNCIRCREVKDNIKNLKLKDLKLDIIKYNASEGKEFFISYNSKDKKTLYGFCRLRLDKGMATIRELHVYGQLVSIGTKKNVQHMGIGKRLIQKAEKISKENKKSSLRIISGIGVREYYRKLGYKLKNTYMIKDI